MSGPRPTPAAPRALIAAVTLALAISMMLPVSSPKADDAPSVVPSPPPATTEWPCVQRRVGTISAGVVWSGPDPAQAGAWDKDFDAAALAQRLASRRTPIEEVDGLLDTFVDKAGADKDARLLRVFAGVLDLINTERNRILQGIGRYARGQNLLAERVRQESDRLSDIVDAPNSTASKDQQEIETALKWDRRIFDERSRALTYVCETPVILERRIFDIARRIQQRL